MINDVVLEGIIIRAWQFADDLFFRLACYRDPDLPQKPLHPSSSAQRADETQEAADFVTIRVTESNLVTPVEIKKGLQVRVHGFLQNRDYQESLADFLKDARGADLTIPENLDPSGLRASRSTTEVIARRIVRQSNEREKS